MGQNHRTRFLGYFFAAVLTVGLTASAYAGIRRNLTTIHNGQTITSSQTLTSAALHLRRATSNVAVLIQAQSAGGTANIAVDVAFSYDGTNFSPFANIIAAGANEDLREAAITTLAPWIQIRVVEQTGTLNDTVLDTYLVELEDS